MVFDEKLLSDEKKLLENDALFYQIYDITTNGHEF
jgi:hypothetical protein